jgi:DNA-binding MarR family transcriptional regulator
MKVVEIFKILKNPLKVMSDFDLKHEDGKHVEMYERFLSMKENCEKYAYIIASLASQYGISESTVKRIIKRLSQEVMV